MFGDTNAVHISVNEKGYNIEQIYRRRNGSGGVGLCAVQSEETGTYARNLGDEISERRKDFFGRRKRIPFQLSFGALRIYLFGITGQGPGPDSPFGELIRNQEMREKLTVIKVGGKIVEEEATLRQLLNDFAAIDGHKVLVHGGGRSAQRLPHNWVLKARW